MTDARYISKEGIIAQETKRADMLREQAERENLPHAKAYFDSHHADFVAKRVNSRLNPPRPLKTSPFVYAMR